MSVLDQTKYYNIMDELFVCCDEHQFKYSCKKCYEPMGCQFCAFNPDEPCECEEE